MPPLTLVPTTCRVSIVDDHEAVRAGLTLVLDSAPRITVVGAFSSGETAVKAFEDLRPDVVVLDYHLSGRDGSWTCSQILRRHPRTAVLILTAFLEENVLLDCLRAGARGFLAKTAQASEVIDAVVRLANQEEVLAPAAVPIVMALARAAKRQWVAGETLAPFEQEILRSMSCGRSNREIAESLRVSEDAVKVRVRSIKRRLGASHRAHAVALAAQRGLV